MPWIAQSSRLSGSQVFQASGFVGLAPLDTSIGDHATDNFLRWFVERQVDEEADVGSIVQKLKLVEDDKYGLFLVDRDLA